MKPPFKYPRFLRARETLSRFLTWAGLLIVRAGSLLILVGCSIAALGDHDLLRPLHAAWERYKAR